MPIEIPTITQLEDLISLSEYAAPAISIAREFMQYDSGHDEAHLIRVARDALYFATMTDFGINLDVLIPAAILHDLVNIPKDHPDRSKASVRSADKALFELEGRIRLPLDVGGQIHHAICAHSYSAKIAPVTIEAKAIQDADRIEALGYIGICRLFSVGGSLGRALWHPTDPVAKNRVVDELAYTLDHVSVKLGKLYTTMQTAAGRNLALERTEVMISFITDLMMEISGGGSHSAIREDVRRFVLN